MSDFQQVRKKGPTIKYPAQQESLVEMGFDPADVSAVLESTNGNLEISREYLLAQDDESSLFITNNKNLLPGKLLKKGISEPSSAKANVQYDATEAQNKFMATYKVVKCNPNPKNIQHDKRTCMYWHSKSDRRRNPFEILYNCTECPNVSETTNTCEEGDACLRAHNMLERMFHPELYKISVCQRGSQSNGPKCERGSFCAFAHSDDDHRIPLSHTLNKFASTSVASAIIEEADLSLSEQIQPGKAMSASKMLDSVQDKLLRLIKAQGNDGIISSELPKRYAEVYSERLELTDEAGEKFRIKDLLLAHPCITMTMHKGVQPKYVYVPVPTTTTTSSSNNNSSSIPSVSSGVSSIVSNSSSITSEPNKPISYSGLISGLSSTSSEPSLSNNYGLTNDLLNPSSTRTRGPSVPLPLDLSLESSNNNNEFGSSQLSQSSLLSNILPQTSRLSNSDLAGINSSSNDNDLEFDFNSFNALSQRDLNYDDDAFGSTNIFGGLSGLRGSSGFSSGTETSRLSALSVGSLQSHLQSQTSSLSSIPPGYSGSNSSPFGGAFSNNSTSSLLGSGMGILGTVRSSSAGEEYKDSAFGTGGSASQMVQFNEKIAIEKAKVTQLQKELLTLNNEYKELLDKNNELSSNTTKLQENCLNLLKAKDVSTTLMNNKDKLLSDLQNKLRTKNEELATANENLQISEKSREKTELTKNSLVPELKLLRTRITEKENNLEKEIEINKKNEKENISLKKELGSIRIELNALKNDPSSKINDSLKAEISSLQSQLTFKNSYIEELDGKIKEISLQNNNNNNNNKQVNNNSNCILCSNIETDENSLLKQIQAYESQLLVLQEKHKSISNNFSIAKAVPVVITSPSVEVTTNDNSIEGEIGSCPVLNCTREASFICTGCSSVRYCGQAHQREHWKLHKKDCSTLKALNSKKKFENA